MYMELRVVDFPVNTIVCNCGHKLQRGGGELVTGVWMYINFGVKLQVIDSSFV